MTYHAYNGNNSLNLGGGHLLWIFGGTCDDHLFSRGVLSLGIRIIGVLKVEKKSTKI